MTRARDLILGGMVAAAVVVVVVALAALPRAGHARHPQTSAPTPTAGAAPAAASAARQTDPPMRNSTLFRWEALKPTETKVGSVRRVVRTSTETLDELESHITTLNAGVASHEPHTHANEEMIILKEGTLEAFVEGAWVPMSTGSMVFFASNHPHAVRNPGTTPATYYVVNWSPPGLLIRNPTGK